MKNKSIFLVVIIALVCVTIVALFRVNSLIQERDAWKEMAFHYYGRADEFLVSIDSFLSITEIHFPDSTLKQEAK